MQRHHHERLVHAQKLALHRFDNDNEPVIIITVMHSKGAEAPHVSTTAMSLSLWPPLLSPLSPLPVSVWVSPTPALAQTGPSLPSITHPDQNKVYSLLLSPTPRCSIRHPSAFSLSIQPSSPRSRCLMPDLIGLSSEQGSQPMRVCPPWMAGTYLGGWANSRAPPVPEAFRRYKTTARRLSMVVSMAVTREIMKVSINWIQGWIRRYCGFARPPCEDAVGGHGICCSHQDLKRRRCGGGCYVSRYRSRYHFGTAAILQGGRGETACTFQNGGVSSSGCSPTREYTSSLSPLHQPNG
jgi:hypothetical protein